MTVPAVTYILRRLAQVITCGEGPYPGRVTAERLGIVEQGSIVIHRGRIAWVGPDRDLSAEWLHQDAVELDLAGHIAFPGLIDPHTHLIYGGDRLYDWIERLRGRSYLEIAARGGGIWKTVQDTRATPDEELKRLLELRLDRLFAFGVTTVEVKSGYGLSEAEELRLLRCLQQVQATHPMGILPTFLGAHAYPRDMDRAEYLDVLTQRLMPEVVRQGLSLSIDAFCDTGYFTVEETLYLLTLARQQGFVAIHLHADEMSHTGLLEAIDDWKNVYSVDHLNHMDARMARVLAEMGVAAVLLPATCFHLGLPTPPFRALLEADAIVAIGSDHNPGTHPGLNPWYVFWIACVGWNLSVEQVLAGMTVQAAYSLRIHGQTGRIAPGLRADLVVVDVPHYGYLLYQWDLLPIRWVFKNGRPYQIRETAEIRYTWMAHEE
jgi:imidazolonepropionase